MHMATPKRDNKIRHYGNSVCRRRERSHGLLSRRCSVSVIPLFYYADNLHSDDNRDVHSVIFLPIFFSFFISFSIKNELKNKPKNHRKTKNNHHGRFS